ncbi:DmsE family decaheme c-type cytochrome [Arhodomonas sp. AD133]|uniref:DmsE family decaheme c-type cytochrome n=1 Tax=Arhodomonas sp. AD133 TaxID=3415009 RepID=UPI003EBD5004
MRDPTIIVRVAVVVCLAAAVVLAVGMAAEDEKGPPPHTRQGADTCLKCHDETSEFPVLSIFRTPHAVTADERTPFANRQCESCHGPGGEHGKRLRFGEDRPPIPAFGENSLWSQKRESGICLECHRESERMHWQGSIHQRYEVGCTSCHTVHSERDPVTVTERQPNVCFDCHVRQRSQAFQASSHPIRRGQMDCTGCHQPHGALTASMLSRPTVNETCYGCHAEMRGPFLWEHAPVAEDCTNCHRPHGSNHPALLNKRPPLLCQQCHSRAGHPSIGRTGDALPGRRPSGFLLGGSCTNCHSQVHGSNHPSGANLSR